MDKKNTLRLLILAKYGSLVNLARQCNICQRAVWNMVKGQGCTLEMAATIEKRSEGYITCVMIQDNIDRYKSMKENKVT